MSTQTPCRIAVLIPVLNEEAGIAQVLRALPREALKAAGHTVQVVVIDGGSTDRSCALAVAEGAEVLRAPRGYGRQFRAAFARIQADLFVTLDGDGSYPAEQIPALVEALLEGELDFLHLDRFGTLLEGAMSPMHQFGNGVLTFWANRLFGLRLRDSQSGMWVFRTRILPALDLRAEGMALSEELKILAGRRFRAAEIPGRYAPRLGTSKLHSWRDGLGNLLYLFRLRLRLLWPGA